MSAEQHPLMPRAQTIYGRIVYIVTIFSCLICAIGPVVSLAFPDNNVLNPYYLFAGIFEGKDAVTVWQEVGGGFPGGHFWFSKFTYGDGFTQFGLALGCSVALWALLASALAYISEKIYLYAILSVWVALLVFLSASGIIKGH